MTKNNDPKKKLIVNIIECFLISLFAILIALILVFAISSPINT